MHGGLADNIHDQTNSSILAYLIAGTSEIPISIDRVTEPPERRFENR
jgi:hypothetical protein